VAAVSRKKKKGDIGIMIDKRSTTTFIAAALVIAVSLMLIPGRVLAGGADTAALQAEIQALKARLAEMEALKQQLQKLEAKISAVETVQVEQQQKTAALEVETKDEGPIKNISVGGALRVNYGYAEWKEQQKDRGGDFNFDIFRLDFNGQYNDLLISAQYRWYSYMDVIHHGWVGYNFTDKLQGQLGVTQVPFGLLPYASHNFWFGVPYYIGLEDDYDMGAKLLYNDGPLNLQFAFFKNEEWGSSSKAARYSFDVIDDGGLASSNSEDNQFNLRAAYTLDHGDLGATEIGFSGEWGMLYNSITEEHGDHWAAAVHLNGNYGPWNLMLEAARYEYDPENPDGVSDDSILMGGFEDSYMVASEGNLYIANLSYDVPVTWGPVTNLTFYDDYSILDKDSGGGDDSHINTLGCLISANPIYTYVDFIMGRNMVWLGSDATEPLAGGEDDDWHMLFNVNIGYYF
jgi:hypothetical protein